MSLLNLERLTEPESPASLQRKPDSQIDRLEDVVMSVPSFNVSNESVDDNTHSPASHLEDKSSESASNVFPATFSSALKETSNLIRISNSHNVIKEEEDNLNSIMSHSIFL